MIIANNDKNHIVYDFYHKYKNHIIRVLSVEQN